MASEFDALLANNTWQLVPPPPGANMVGCCRVYEVKQKDDCYLKHFEG